MSRPFQALEKKQKALHLYHLIREYKLIFYLKTYRYPNLSPHRETFG